jgi:uncharacterized protein (DUF3084 family)
VETGSPIISTTQVLREQLDRAMVREVRSAAGLDSRENAVQAREAAVQAREAAVQAREVRIDGREDDIRAREVAIQARETLVERLAACEMDAKHRKAESADREATLVESYEADVRRLQSRIDSLIAGRATADGDAPAS